MKYEIPLTSASKETPFFEKNQNFECGKQLDSHMLAL